MSIVVSPDFSAEFAQINANIDAKISEAKAHVTAKSTSVKNLVASENDATQVTLSNMSTGDDLNANTASVNAHTSRKISEVNGHVTDENNRVLARLAENSAVKMVQRGKVSLNGSMEVNVPVSAVDVSKSVLNVSCVSALGTLYSGAQVTATAGAYIKTPTYISVAMGAVGSAGTYASGWLFWELIEYV